MDLSVAMTLAGVLLVFILPLRQKAWVNCLFVALNALVTSWPAIRVLTSGTLDCTLWGSSFFGNIPVRIDALSAWFILIINFTTVNGALYGIGYMKRYQEQKSNTTLHWALYMVFHASMLWVCMLQHSIAFLIAWELMSLSSMMLVIFEHEKKNTLKAGLNYLVQMHIGVALLTLAFIWVYMSTGSFDFQAIGDFFRSNSNVTLFLLFFAGFGIKAGFIPFHTWLPQAHPAAPSHISGVMSGVIVKLGIYGILRVVTMLKQDFFVLGEIVIILSIVTGLFGIFNASVHRNFKKMLAYCTIENIGIIGMGIGLGLIGLSSGKTVLIVAGFGGALLHTLNHSLFKSLLFFAAGSVYQQTHTKNMEKLGGLIRYMPHTAVLFLAGAVAIGGLPPFNGFVSEFILYSGFLEGIKTGIFNQIVLMIFSVAGLSIIGGISVLAFTKNFGIVFLGNPRHPSKHPVHEVSFLMRLPQYVIVLVMLSVGLFPGIYFSAAVKTVVQTFPLLQAHDMPYIFPYSETLTGIATCSLVFLVLVSVLLMVRSRITRRRSLICRPTWGCAYTGNTIKLQYTGKSFSKSLAKLLNFAALEEKKYGEIEAKEIFPKERVYASSYIDVFGIMINKLSDRLIYAMNYFQFVQNGNMQMYILYGLLFIVLIFAGTLFNFI